MAEGFLGGLSDFAGGVGDFFTGGGVYGDPKNINQRYGVPEADVRQAGLGALGNVGALLLAAGQSPDRGQRAQFLGQLGGAVSGMNTDIYKSSQARLMNAQQQQARQEMEELSAIDQRRKSDPTGLAREMNLPEQAIRALPARDLRDLAKKTIIAQATISPAQRALNEAARGRVSQQPAAPGVAPDAPPQMQQPAAPVDVIPQSFLSSLPPESRRAVETIQRAIDDPRTQSDPAMLKNLLENRDRLIPGFKESQVQAAKQREAMIANKPKAFAQVETSEEQNRVASGLIDSALGNLEKNKNQPFFYPGVAGVVGGRLAGYNQEATDLRADLDAIKSLVGSEKIKEMKAQSQTGATGYGSLAVRELDRIEATLGSLDQLQDPDKLAERLGIIKKSFENYQKNTKLAYKEMYGEEYKPRQPGGPQRITSEAQFNSLKSGDEFIDPNGQLRRKP
jgi:hypothetical protein